MVYHVRSYDDIACWYRDVVCKADTIGVVTFSELGSLSVDVVRIGYCSVVVI